MPFLSAACVLNQIILVGLLGALAAVVVVGVWMLVLTPLLPITRWLRDASARGLRRAAAVQDRLWRRVGDSEPARLATAMRQAASQRSGAAADRSILDELVDLAVLAVTLFAGFLLIAVAVTTVGLHDVLMTTANTLLSFALGPALVVAAAYPFFVLHNREEELRTSNFRKIVAQATLVVALAALALFALVKSADYLRQNANDEWLNLVEIMVYVPLPFFWIAAALAVAGAAALADRGFYALVRIVLYLLGATLALLVFAIRAVIWLAVGVPILALAIIYVVAQLLALLPEALVNWVSRVWRARREAGGPGEPEREPVVPGPAAGFDEGRHVGGMWEPEATPAAAAR